MMKSTGMVRKIDNLGRIVVPKEIRSHLDIKEGDPVEIFIDGEKIILQKYEPSCMFCGNAGNVVYFKGKLVCTDCLRQIKEQF